MEEFAYRECWIRPAGHRQPTPLKITFYCPEGRDDLFEAPLSIESSSYRFSTRLFQDDAMSALLSLPLIADADLSRLRDQGDEIWWREPADFDSLAFWRPSSHPVEIGLGTDAPTQSVGCAGWVIAPGQGEPQPLSIALGRPRKLDEHFCEACVSIQSSCLSASLRVRALDGLQALMTMRAAGEAYWAARQRDGWRFFQFEPDEPEVLSPWDSPLSRARWRQ